jgi:MscS family membrane protein
MEDFLARFSIHSENAWLVGAIDAAVIGFFYFLIMLFHKSIVQIFVKRIPSKLKLTADDSILLSFDKFLKRFVTLYALALALDNFPLALRLQRILQDAIYFVTAVFTLAFVFDLINILGSMLGRWNAKEFQTLFNKISKTVAFSIALMIVMRHFNYDIWHIVTALGIGSLAIGLAAQPTLSNMIAGFTLLLDRPFLPGDRILLSSGNEGDVQQIGMRSTRILTTDGNSLIVPNSELVNSRLINYNYPTAQLAQRIRVLFEFDENFGRLKELLTQSAKNTEDVVSESTKVLFSNVVDGKIELSIIYRLETFAYADQVKDRIIQAVLQTLATQNIRLASFTLPTPTTKN